MWDATQYLRYGDERARPFLDLIGRVGAEAPSYVADLGCGPGNLTALLARRWPRARVIGVDSSPEMIRAASALSGPALSESAVPEPALSGSALPEPALSESALPEPALSGSALPEPAVPEPALSEAPSLSFQLGDVRDWRGDSPPDVITCNAVLQWVPGHDGLVRDWADMLAPGGWLAFQLPGNFSSPSHVIVRELAASARWRALLADAELNRQAADPGDYVDLLARTGYTVDAWETTYHHILPGDNAVVEWTMGTTLRPVLALLDSEQAASFLADYAERLRGAYKVGPLGTVFPFRRVFAVAHRI